MDISFIRQAIHRQTFRPFTFRLADGRSLQVLRPEFVAVSPSGREMAVFSGPEESLLILEPRLIMSIDYAATQQAAPPENGSHE